MFAPDDILPESGFLVQRPQTRKPATVSDSFNCIVPSYQIVKTFPGYGTFEYHVMEDITFKAIVRIDEMNLPCEEVKCELWTNLRHLNNDEGIWHCIELPYRGAKGTEHHVYGQAVVLVEDGMFDYIFKARTTCELIGTFYPGEDDYSKLVVNPPKNLVLYAEILRVPFMSHIIGPLWSGNEWAGMQSIVNGFTHIMCAAEELPDPVEDLEGRCYCRAPFIQGTRNPLHREIFKRAVIWIKRSMRDGYKILVYSRHGFGRTGSVLVGFVMMENPIISFEEALKRTFERRPVLPHKQLKEICEGLFRQSLQTFGLSEPPSS